MLLDSEISALKKIGLCLGLGIGGIVVLTGPAKEPAGAFIDFLATATDISVSAFDNTTHKQVAVDRLVDLAGLISHQHVEPGTLNTNPESYARVALMHFDGQISRPIDHAGKPSAQEIAQHIASDLGRLMTPTDQSSEMFDGPSDEASAALLQTVESALKGQAQGAVLLGYDIEYKNRAFNVHLVQANEAILANNVQISIQEKVPLQANSDKDWHYGKFDQDSVAFTSSLYSAPVLESFSQLGYQGALAYKSIHQASSAFFKDTKFMHEAPLPSDYLAYALPFQTAWSMFVRSSELPSAFEKAGQAYAKDFGEHIEAWKYYSTADFRSSVEQVMQLKEDIHDFSQKVANKASWDVYAEYTSRATTDFRLTLSQPCPANLSTLISSTQYARAYEFSKSCSDDLGYPVSANWLGDYGAAINSGRSMNWPALLGFEQGVPVYSIVDTDRGGFVKGTVVTDPNDNEDPYRYLFIGVDPGFGTTQNLHTKDLLMAAQFVLHHEMGHVLYNTKINQSDPGDTLGLRSMDIESQMDVYATQKLVSQGYDKSDVLRMHKQFSESLSPDPESIKKSVGDQYVASAKRLLWHNGRPVDKENALEEMRKTIFTNPFEVLKNWATESFATMSANTIEYKLRYEEVRRNLENFNSGDVPTLEQSRRLEERARL